MTAESLVHQKCQGAQLSLQPPCNRALQQGACCCQLLKFDDTVPNLCDCSRADSVPASLCQGRGSPDLFVSQELDMDDFDWDELLHVLSQQGVAGPPVAPGLLNSLQQLKLEAPLQQARPVAARAVIRPSSHKRKAGGSPEAQSGRSQSQRQQLDGSRECLCD